MSENVLEVQGLSKGFRRGELYDSLRDLLPAIGRGLLRRSLTSVDNRKHFWALRDVSFSVKHGEAFGIIGGNGAGKSTILKLLTGIMRPTSGAIRVDGRISALIEVGAGFHPDFTGRENIYLNGAILGMTREQTHKRFDEIVAFSGLEEFLDTPVKRYSSGMYARLGFSVAAHVDSDLLLVDEVLSVGDYLFQEKCIARMNQVIAGGSAVVFVSHNLREVANLCTRSLLLERGQVQTIGPTPEVIRTYYERGRTRRNSTDRNDVAVTVVTLHDEKGSAITFESDSKIWVTVEVHARVPCNDVSIVIQLVDDHQYPVFDTCSARLGNGGVSLDANQVFRCSFELGLCLAEGTFHLNVYAHRYTTNKAYDSWMTAATFFVAGAKEVRGVVTLHPKLTLRQIESASDRVDSAQPEKPLCAMET